ncbi:MAG: hypothetical protein ACLQVD_14690 [Capsulimonadaceae bacterium]
MTDTGREALLAALRTHFPRYPNGVYPDRWKEVTHVDPRTVAKMLETDQPVRQSSIVTIFADLGAHIDEDVHIDPSAAVVMEPLVPVSADSSTNGSRAEHAPTYGGGDTIEAPGGAMPDLDFPHGPAVEKGENPEAGPSLRSAGAPDPTTTMRSGRPNARVVGGVITAVLIALVIAAMHLFEKAPRRVEPGVAPTPIASIQTESTSTGQVLLYDHFSAEKVLDPNQWAINGPAAQAALKNYQTYSTAVVTPNVTFDPQNGLGIAGVNAGQQGGIQSIRRFTPPFTVTALCNATQIHGDPLRLAISSADGRKGISLGFGAESGDGGQAGGFVCAAPSGPGAPWQPVGNPLSPLPPPPDIWYVLAIAVDESGKASVEVSSGDVPIGTSGGDVGRGPFHVILSQSGGPPGAIGPNQAYCGVIEVISRAEE